jgi:vacuolar-type H+-ATPase subunit F/Vma7
MNVNSEVDRISTELKAYFDRTSRLSTLSTADKDGKVNAAYFGSPETTDEKTVEMALMTNRALKNLRENPWAGSVMILPFLLSVPSLLPLELCYQKKKSKSNELRKLAPRIKQLASGNIP